MKTFAERLKSARVMAGLSLQDLAGKLQSRVTRQALHKYEKGEFMPDSEMLGSLCDALGVRPDYFYRKTEVKMREISFRKLQNFPAKDRKSLEERVKDVLERYLELEQILNIPTDFALNFKDRPVNSNQDVEHIAIELRKAWNLGREPIFNLIELLEENKIKVIEIEADNAFDGLSAWANDGAIPVIVLNNSIIKSLDGKRLTALHELARLILNLDGHTESRRRNFAITLLARCYYLQIR